MGLASILLERRAEEVEGMDSSDDGLNEADELLKASVQLLTSDEGRGVLLVKRSWVAKLRGDREQESQLLEQALPYLRRCNSRHIDTVEATLQRLKDTGNGHASYD